MATFLFDKVVFGPIRSRRLGWSLGVNLLPTDSKLCNFNCIYCECGWTGVKNGVKPRFNDKETVRRELEAKLRAIAANNEPLDVITFAGNGEPTMHPDFAEIIGFTIALRDQYTPEARVSVLSNATMIGRPGVFEALNRVDNNILKLDSAFDDTVRLIDNPLGNYSVEEIIALLQKFNGRAIVQTMFLRGEYNGQTVDNTTEKELEAWLGALKRIAPKQVMIYTIDRDTPARDLHKVSHEELERIASKVRELGIECSVAS